MGGEAGRCKTSTPEGIFIMTPSLEGWPTKAKEAPSPHEVRLAPLDTNPVFHSLRDKWNWFKAEREWFQQKREKVWRAIWWSEVTSGWFLLLNRCYLYTAPDLKDEITAWTEKGKEKMKKYYLTMYLCDVYAMFKTVYPDSEIGFTMFTKLRPKNLYTAFKEPTYVSM